MSLIKLDDFTKIDNTAEIKLPRVETVWKVTFNDEFRKKASLVASEVQKLYQKQNSKDYEDTLLKMPYSKRKERISKDLDEYRDACFQGINDLLNDGKAGKEIYDAYDGSTEVVAQVIGKLNDACDQALDLDAKESKKRMSKYDAE